MTREVKMVSPGYDWESLKPESWTEDAACINKPQYFEMLEDDKPYGQSNEQKLKNIALFDIAERICSKCPVIKECYDSATPEELRDTYRAGLMPTSFSPNLRGRPRADMSERVCKYGHVGQYRFKATKEKYVCGECVRLRDVRAARAKGIGPRKPPRTECEFKHEDTFFDSNGHFRCRECRRIYDAQRRGKDHGKISA